MADNYPGYAFDRGGQKVICLILHDTSGGDTWTAAQWMAYWKNVAQSDNPTSCHMTIMRDGGILRIVPDTMASAGAGYGVVLGYNQWNPNAQPEPRPEPNLNRAAINIEIVAPAVSPVAYPPAQVAAVDAVCRQYLLAFPTATIYSHAEVDRQAVAQGYNPALAHHDPRDWSMDAWRERMSKPAPPPPTPPDTIELVRRTAWNGIPVSYNPTSAFSVYARSKGYGAPLTNEWAFTSGGISYSGQGYTGKIIYCVTGQWGNLLEANW